MSEQIASGIFRSRAKLKIANQVQPLELKFPKQAKIRQTPIRKLCNEFKLDKTSELAGPLSTIAAPPKNDNHRFFVVRKIEFWIIDAEVTQTPVVIIQIDRAQIWGGKKATKYAKILSGICR